MLTKRCQKQGWKIYHQLSASGFGGSGSLIPAGQQKDKLVSIKQAQ